MNHVAGEYGWLEAPQAYVSLKHEEDKMIVFERAGLVFVFNFHPVKSYADYRVGVEVEGEYGVVLNSDERERFGGFDNVESGSLYFTMQEEWHGRRNWLQVCFVLLVLGVGGLLMVFFCVFLCFFLLLGRFIFLLGLVWSLLESKKEGEQWI